MSKSLSIVIPALNEEQGIGPTIDSIPMTALTGLGYTVEILVVDGNSKDRTKEIAEAKGARVIVDARKGYGRAYRTGFELAQGDVIITADADLTYPLDHIPQLLADFEQRGLDFMTTNRFARLQPGAMKTKHKFGNWVLSWTARALFFVNFKDSQSGMWLLRRSMLPNLRLVADGMEFSEELKIEAYIANKRRATEVPIEYRVRVGEVKLSSWKDGTRCLLFLWKKRFGLVRASKQSASRPLPSSS
jgi:glycosyltransferase involved in cell wall biosynthesis